MKGIGPMSSTTLPKEWQRPILRDVWKYVYAKRGNCVIGITGRPNTGKSWTADKICIEMKPGSNTDDYLCYNVETIFDKTFQYAQFKGKPMSLKMVQDIRNIDQWLEDNRGYIEFEPGNCIMFDEAGVGAFVREFFKKGNMMLGKIIQIWRFLRMIVLIVVPGDMSLADSILRRFLNLEICMVDIHPDGYARAIGYEIIGWDKRKKQPIRRRIRGCRFGGFMKIKPLNNEQAEEYEKAMWHSKFGGMMRMAQEFKVQTEEKVGKTKSIWDDIEHVRTHKDDFQKNGKWNLNLIKVRLGISVFKARSIKTILEQNAHQEEPPKQP